MLISFYYYYFIGFLSKPVESYPSIFGNLGALTDFLVEYPYFLPCFISAFICSMGLISGIFFLEETLGGVHLQEKKQKSDEQQPLLAATTDTDQYHTFDEQQQQDTEVTTKKVEPPTLKEALTPTVWAVSISYAIYAYQVVFYDGKKRSIHMHIYIYIL